VLLCPYTGGVANTRTPDTSEISPAQIRAKEQRSNGIRVPYEREDRY
jgi:hypothetical protein